MDTWIISDRESVVLRIRTALQRQTIDCPSTRVLGVDLVGPNAEVLTGISGVVFFGVMRLEASHLDFIARFRAAINTEAKIVIVSYAMDRGAVLSAVRAGASDFLSLDNNFDNDLGAFIARFRLEGKKKDPRGWVATVIPCQSPDDENMLSVNLSAAFATRLGSCGLLDFQVQGGNLALLLKLTPRHTLLDLLNQQDTIDESMFTQALSTHECGVQLLSGSQSFEDTKSLTVKACQQIISLAKWSWPAVVINAESIQQAVQLQMLAVSDKLILTTRLDIVSLHFAQQCLDYLEDTQMPRDHVHVVAVGTGVSSELPLAGVKKILNVKKVHCIPDDRTVAVMSINIGNPLVLEPSNSRPAQAMRALAESMMHGAAQQPKASGRSPVESMKAATKSALSAILLCK